MYQAVDLGQTADNLKSAVIFLLKTRENDKIKRSIWHH